MITRLGNSDRILDPVPVAADSYILFRLGASRYALPRGAVREVLPLPRLWHPPGLPGPLAGFLNLGGAAVPVLDLARLFGQAGVAEEGGLYRHLLRLEDARGQPLALLVDRVLDLLRAEPGALRPLAPEATLNGCVRAEIETEQGFVHLLDPGLLLLAQEQAALAALRDTAQARLAEWADVAGGA